MDPDEPEATLAVAGAFLEELAASGAVVFAGGLHPPSTAVTVDHTGDDLVLADRVVSGHLCFPGGVGNTQKDPPRFASLIDDVGQGLFGTLPDDTWVYPGHGKDTTIGTERPHLGEWRGRGW
ncbi:hypothetical protein [Geodermatophilus sp. CPCC 205506]|uniref:hypothetical protein n=1 Tax=Geodermatophilus sp. CPCC 205506 TaxID=2936596 RepID=UPI003EE86E9E